MYKLTRIVAWSLRFCKNISCNKLNKTKGNLTLEETEGALRALLKLAQKQSFTEEIRDLSSGRPVRNRSVIKSLDPFVDSHSLLRVGGRIIRNSNVDFGIKFPIILPQRHSLKRLIIIDQHHKQLHAGPQTILANLRSNYWPINGRNAIRSAL